MRAAGLEERITTIARKEEEMKSSFVIAQGQRASKLLKTMEDSLSCSL